MKENGAMNDDVELGSPDANIPLVAIEAANELDEVVKGRSSDFKCVLRPANLLKKSFRLEAGEDSRQGFVDSGSVAVFLHAVDPAGQRVSNLQELAQKAAEIVNGLETSATAERTSSLENMRDFCIALSRAAAAYQESIFEMEPSDPLRI